MSTFKAVYATQQDGKTHISIQQLDRASLPAGDVLVRVRYSDLNYKDGLAVTGRPGVIRKFPMVAGIDLAGVVEESASAEWKPGDEVVVTGFGLSESVWGGYAELARVHAHWLVRLPRGLTLKQAMAIGTAGFTAMQC
ncbi:MAG: alcohol dehydrogenase catalytic domain-containing protein, partial [Acidobacteriota bacterium]|nr:alcohol dehydrogenase catalytic domain-containing protein [Acidobacteriota bacterium]